MRIIAGEKRGMQLKTLQGEETRPTLERVKEGMFSAIQFLLPGAKVLDLFAGSGQLGLEALSRGAAFCTFVDAGREAAQLVRANCEALGLAAQSHVVRSDVETFLAHCHDTFDIVLLDPPYRAGVLPGLLPKLARVAAPGAVVLCESEPQLPFPEEAAGLRLQKQYRYGTVLVTRYHMPQTL